MPQFRSIPFRAARAMPSIRLYASKGRLAITAAAFAAALTLNNALPAEAAPTPAEVAYAQEVQSFDVDLVNTVAPVLRDGFDVVSYSVVQWPVPSSTPVSSGYGGRYAPCAGCSTDHDGVDLTPGLGAPIAAMADGIVVEVGNPSGGLGVYSMVEHVINGVGYTSVYGHMQLGSLRVRVGDSVVAGQMLGTVGSTGQSTGPHLHLELWDAAGGRLNPLTWLAANANR